MHANKCLRILQCWRMPCQLPCYRILRACVHSHLLHYHVMSSIAKLLSMPCLFAKNTHNAFVSNALLWFAFVIMSFWLKFLLVFLLCISPNVPSVSSWSHVMSYDCCNFCQFIFLKTSAIFIQPKVMPASCAQPSRSNVCINLHLLHWSIIAHISNKSSSDPSHKLHLLSACLK